MTDNDAVSLKCKLFLGNSILFGLFGFGLVLCLGILKACAHLALSFETIRSHSASSKTIPDCAKLKPNAYLITSHRNALRSRFLRAQRQRPEFVLRYCSIISIMLNNVATSNPRAAEQRSGAATKGDQQPQQEAQQQSYHSSHISTDQQLQQPQQNAKKSTGNGLFQHPPPRKNVTFGWRYVACMLYITHYLSISHVPNSPLVSIIDPLKVVCHFFVML